MVVLENVAGLGGNKNRHVLRRILERLCDAGYEPAAKHVNTNSYGLPHNRERIYIIAVRRDHAVLDFDFPAEAGATIGLAFPGVAPACENL